jgi:DNA-binding NarL/FixJ family response regulator
MTERLSVLLADDDASTRRSLREAIEADTRFTVVAEAGDAAAAVRAAFVERPELAVLAADLQLPGVGIHACREIAARLPDTVLVILSESDRDEELLAAVRAGCSGFLPKEMELRRLPDALWDAARGGGAAIPRRLVSRLLSYLRDPNTLRRHVSANNAAPLTSREWQILDLLANGLTSMQVARQLSVSVATVRSHRSRINRKLNPDKSLEADLQVTLQRQTDETELPQASR